jgi:DNA-binding LacI/PurR family transcriptional regulator
MYVQEGAPARGRNSTSADVARLAGVSRGAVSQILNGHGGRFAAATRERVLEAARALAYEPSLAGRTLARGKSDVVVAVVPHTTFGANLQDILEAMTEELARNGLMLVTRFSTSDVTSFDGFIAAVQPVAVVTMADLADDHLDVLRLRRAPLVGAAGTTDEKGAGHDLIGALQARHLFDRGHRRLSYAHLKDRRQNLYGQPRYEGFRTTCDQLGLPEPDIIELAIDSEEATAHLRKLGRSTAIACYNDDVALTLLSAGQHLEIAVPADLALIGVDNTALGRAAFPRLTTIGYDTDEIARMLTHRVLSTVGVSVPSPPAPPRFEIIQGGTS